MKQAADLPGRPAWLGFLPDFLFELDRWAERYIAKAWLVMLIPSLLVSAAVNLLLRPQTHPDVHIDGVAALLIFVVIGPLIETLIQALILEGLTRMANAGVAATLCATIWAILHSLAVPSWGLMVWWPFLILSIAYLTWRTRGITRAIAMTAAIHAVYDGMIILTLVLCGYS